MLIGLTYDLRSEYLLEGYTLEETAEFDRADTIEALESALRALGHQTERIGNARQLVRRLAAGARWDLVFNIAEGLRGYGREAQVPALLDIYDIPCTFSDVLLMSLCLHKGFTKQVMRDLGLPTPDFVLVTGAQDVARVDLPLPLFAKPVAEGTGKGVNAHSIVRNRRQLAAVCRRLLQQYRQPVLVERFLPGREFTVGLLGTGERARALGVIEVVLRDNAEPEVYSYDNKERCEERVEYRIADDATAREAECIALECWRRLGGHDAGRIDLRADEQGRPQVLEVNPLAGLHPEHSDLPILCNRLGIPYVELVAAIVDSALERRMTAPVRRSARVRTPAVV